MSWIQTFLSALAKPLKWWIVVAPWERGVRVRLGRTATELRPGPHWRIPFLDRLYVQSVRLRTVSESHQTLSTLDGKTVTVSFAVAFAIGNVLRLYEAVYNPEHTLTTLVAAEVARVVTQRPSSEISPVLVEREVNDKITPLVEQWGLERARFSIIGFAFVRTYRLLSNDYRTGAGLWDIDKDNSGER